MYRYNVRSSALALSLPGRALLTVSNGNVSSENSFVDRHDLEAVARTYDFAENSGEARAKQRPVELGHRVATADVTEI